MADEDEYFPPENHTLIPMTVTEPVKVSAPQPEPKPETVIVPEPATVIKPYKIRKRSTTHKHEPEPVKITTELVKEPEIIEPDDNNIMYAVAGGIILACVGLFITKGMPVRAKPTPVIIEPVKEPIAEPAPVRNDNVVNPNLPVNFVPNLPFRII